MNIEASSAYHRFVTEMFLIAAMHAEQRGLEGQRKLPSPARRRCTLRCGLYQARRGALPCGADADDGRVLPLGGGPVNYHRHLIASVAAYLHHDELAGSRTAGKRSRSGSWEYRSQMPSPRYPKDSGIVSPLVPAPIYYEAISAMCLWTAAQSLASGIERRPRPQRRAVFFQAALDGINVVEESGCFVYTASFQELKISFARPQPYSTPAV